MEVLKRISESAAASSKQFVVIGGHAVNAHGISRQTGDLDLIVRRSDRTYWDELLKAWRYSSFQQDDRFARYAADTLLAWPINLMFVDHPTFDKHDCMRILCCNW